MYIDDSSSQTTIKPVVVDVCTNSWLICPCSAQPWPALCWCPWWPCHALRAPGDQFGHIRSGFSNTRPPPPGQLGESHLKLGVLACVE